MHAQHIAYTRRVFALFAAASLTLVAFGGFATGTLTQLGFPVNPILIGAAGTVLSVAVAVTRFPYTLRGLVAPVLLWLTMISGFVYTTRSTEYADEKVLYLLTLTPLLVGGSVILLALPEVRSRLLLCIVGWGGFIAVLQYLYPSDEGNPLTMSAEGSSYQNYGRAVAAAAVVLVVLAARRRASSVLFLPLGLGFLALAFTSGSRGPALAAVAAIAVGLMVSRLPVLVTLTAVVVGFLVVQLVDIQQYLPTRFQSFEDNSVQDRLIMFEIAYDQFKETPFGLGWGELAPLLASVRLQLVYVHNVFVEVALEAGIIALIGLAVYVVYGFVGQYKVTASGVESAMLALAVFMTGIASVSGDFNSNRGFHLMVGAGIAAWTMRRHLASVETDEPDSVADEPVTTGPERITPDQLARGRWN